MTESKLLWRVLQDAYSESMPNAGKSWLPQDGYAAEIRAFADWLVPEETEWTNGAHGQSMQIAREFLRDILLAEVTAAEADR